MNIQELEDGALVEYITYYRESVGGRHGPPSLDHMADGLVESGWLDTRPSKSTLSTRIKKLVESGRLNATVINGLTLAFSLEENTDWDGD